MARIFEYLDYKGRGVISIDQIIDGYRREFHQEPNEIQMSNLRNNFSGLDCEAIEFSNFIVHAFNEDLLLS